MKTFEIFWNDLSMDKQIELREIYHDNIHMAPIAIIEIEDADITPEDFEGPMSDVTLFYRDASNYKYTEVYEVPTAKLDAARKKLGKAFYDQDDAQIQYDYDLGISREDFHSRLAGYYNDELDHNFVIIEAIDGVPNTHPEEAIAHSSHGSFTFDPFTGDVITVDLGEDFGSKPVKVDVGEWRTFHKKFEMPEELDILDIGYETADGQYVEAESGWRMERIKMQAGEEL